jgi:hypothetical protein
MVALSVGGSQTSAKEELADSKAGTMLGISRHSIACPQGL